MKIAAICHRCGDIADADYGAFQHNYATTDTRGAANRIVTIHCPACGIYERPPHCHVDRIDAALLPLLVL